MYMAKNKDKVGHEDKDDCSGGGRSYMCLSKRLRIAWRRAQQFASPGWEQKTWRRPVSNFISTTMS